MIRKALAVVLLALLVFPARGGEPASPAGRVNAFALDLYGRLRTGEGNLFLSPYSIHVALSMTAEGARGETARQMREVLRLGGGETAREHQALGRDLAPPTIRDVYGKERSDPYALAIANAVWVQEGLGLLAPFSSTLAERYGGPPEAIDFRQAAKARERINAWAAERTMDRIRDLLPPDLPTPETLLVLANAIHFKAQWDRPFDSRFTKDRPFHAAGGVTRTVPTMFQVVGCRYAETEDAQVLELPYLGGLTRMLIVLPKARDGLGRIEAGLDAEALDGWLGSLEFEEVAVSLPRFGFSSAFELGATLGAMGMSDAFSAGKADFTGITADDPLYVSAVIHKAFVRLDESGTEAAAATAVVMDRGGPPESPPEFTADHPFLFLIRHEPTGCVLFLGRLADPGE